MNTQNLKELIRKQQDGFTLDQTFYLDPEIFKLDYVNFFLNHWVFVDHISSLDEIGDFFIFNLTDDDVRVSKLEDTSKLDLFQITKYVIHKYLKV